MSLVANVLPIKESNEVLWCSRLVKAWRVGSLKMAAHHGVDSKCALISGDGSSRRKLKGILPSCLVLRGSHDDCFCSQAESLMVQFCSLGPRWRRYEVSVNETPRPGSKLKGGEDHQGIIIVGGVENYIRRR